MAMAKQGGKENNIVAGHVAICPYPFASHTRSILNLAIRLANATPETDFSFLTTTTSKHSIISSSSSSISLPTNLKIYTIYDGIPKENYQQDHTNDHYHMHCFNMAMPGNFKQGIAMAVKENNGKKKITYIIADTFSATGVAVISKEMEIPWVALWIGAPFAFHTFFRMDHIYQLSLQSHHDDHQIIPGFSPLRFTDLRPKHSLQPSGGAVGWTFFLPIMRVLPEASAIIMNTYQELCVSHHDEEEYYSSSCLEPKLRKLLFVGNFLTLLVDANYNDDMEGGIFTWLERQRVGSVVYVSLGTISALCDEEITAMAEALQVYEFPFLWSLKESHRGRLPCGFVERTGKYGKVVSWAPQAEVLRHGAIGVHVTHSGYNSVCESILGGVPLICRSVWSDSHIMRRWVEEVWRIGVGVEGGVITKDGMCTCLQAALHDQEKGMKMRANIAALREKMLEAAGPNGRANKDFEALLQMMHAGMVTDCLAPE